MQVIGIPSAFIRLKEPFVWYRFKSSVADAKAYLRSGCQRKIKDKKSSKNRSQKVI